MTIKLLQQIREVPKNILVQKLKAKFVDFNDIIKLNFFNLKNVFNRFFFIFPFHLSKFSATNRFYIGYRILIYTFELTGMLSHLKTRSLYQMPLNVHFITSFHFILLFCKSVLVNDSHKRE